MLGLGLSLPIFSNRSIFGGGDTPIPPPDLIINAASYPNDAGFRATIWNGISTWDNPALAGTFVGPGAFFASGRYPDLVTLDNTNTYLGLTSYRLRFPPSSNATPMLAVNMPGGRQYVWVRRKIRFEPGFTLAGPSGAYKMGAAVIWTGGPIAGRLEMEYENNTQLRMKSNLSDGTTVFPAINVSMGNRVNEWTDGLWYEDVIGYNTVSSTEVDAYASFGSPGSPRVAVTGKLLANPGKTIPLPTLLQPFNENWNNNRGPSEEYFINHCYIEVWFSSNPLGVL